MTLTGAPKPAPHLTTLHAIGDMHYGGTTSTYRHDTIASDVNTSRPAPVVPTARMILGDLTNNGLTSEDASYLAWEATLGTAAPVYKVLGNHDVLNDVRTPEAAATALGASARNYTVDLGDVLLVGLFPGDSFTAFNNGSQLSTAAKTWLDNTLRDAGKDCWVCCHFPLYDTVGGVGATQFLSTDTGFYISTPAVTATSADILAILNSRTNAKAWLSAHTHSNIDTPGMVGATNVGSRTVATINASAIVSTDRAGSPRSPIRACYVTRDSSSQLSVRYRGHGGRTWAAPTDQARVLTVATS